MKLAKQPLQVQWCHKILADHMIIKLDKPPSPKYHVDMSTSTGAARSTKSSKAIAVGDQPSAYQSIVSESAKTLIGAIESQMDKLRQQVQFLQEMTVQENVTADIPAHKAVSVSKPKEAAGTFAERAVNFLKSNGPSKASAVIRAFGLAPNSATVRMQQLQQKGIVRQDKKSRLWEVAE